MLKLALPEEEALVRGTSFDVLMICLNDVATIRESVKSLLKNHPSNIVIVDGGSVDGTVEQIRNLGIEPISSVPGIRRQIVLGNSHLQSDFVFLGEADQSFPEGLIGELLDELERTQLDGIQVTKVYRRTSNWFELSHGRYLDVHRRRAGRTDFINGPQLWRTPAWRALIQATIDNEGYSFDTELSEKVRELGFAIGVSALESEEVGQITLKRLVARVRNYGLGDYTFYKTYAQSWSAKRKMQSLSHILRRYGFAYPVVALREHRMPLDFVLYLWTLGTLRYFFWFSKIIKESIKVKNPSR